MTRYCVIGAGAAGLAAVKTLAESGREVDCFEATDRVGGHWNTDYDALHLITSRDVTGFEGFPMPADYPAVPVPRPGAGLPQRVRRPLRAPSAHPLRDGRRLRGPGGNDGLGRISRLGRHDHRRPGAAL